MADWGDFKPDTESGSGWEGFTPDPPAQPSLMRRALNKVEDVAGTVGSGARAGLDIATGMPAESSLTGQNMPSLQKGSDPVALMAQHPYATAAAVGAATGPTIPIAAAMTEGMPYASAGLGAIE